MCAMRVIVFLLVFVVIVKFNNCISSEEYNSSNLITTDKGSSEKFDVCKTKGCIQSSKRFKRNMDKSVDPCNDFYRFACGNFLKTEKIPKKELQSSLFTKLGTALLKLVRPLLHNGSKHDKNIQAFKMARYLYKVCMREDLIEARGIGMFLKTLKDAGGWPVLEGRNWDEGNNSWVDTTFKLQDNDLNGNLIDVSMRPDYSDSFVNIVKVDQISFGLDKVYLVQGRRNKKVLAYGRLMIDLAKLFGAKHSSAVKEMKEVLDFEIKLAKIALSPAKKMKPSIVKLPIEHLQETHPLVNWIEFLGKTFKYIVSFEPNDQVMFAADVYLKKLHKLLKKTDKRTIANYQFWVAVKSKSKMLTKTITDRLYAYDKETGGAKERLPRWELCVNTVIGTFSLAVSSMYVRHVFNKDLKGIITEMVHRIHNEMMKILENLSWMDDETRLKAMEKGKALKFHIAYPEELLNDEKIENYYDKLNIIGDPLYEAMTKLEKFILVKGFYEFHKRINKTDWRSHGNILEVNAAYNPSENSVQIPAGILQDLLVSSDLPKYMVYAVIGFAIGHEMTHAFDNSGRLTDKDGNMIDWWKPETMKQIYERIKYVINDANNYTMKSVHMKLKGTNILGEVISDLGGGKLAMAGYNELEQTFKKPEPRLVGFEQFSNRQIFWITVANSWCTKMTKDALRDHILTNEHAPQEYRIINTLRNHETFGKDFNCPEGSPMNPTKKCNVW